MDRSAKRFVKPADRRRRIHFPGREEGLHPDGEFVPSNDYWQRRLNHGAVVECSPPAEAADAESNQAAVPTPEAPAKQGKKGKRAKNTPPAEAADAESNQAE